jgi:hypothetical protein
VRLTFTVVTQSPKADETYIHIGHEVPYSRGHSSHSAEGDLYTLAMQYFKAGVRPTPTQATQLERDLHPWRLTQRPTAEMKSTCTVTMIKI